MTAKRMCPKCGDTVELEKSHIEAASAEQSKGKPGVDIDVCKKCRGVWLDWGELGRLRDLRDVLNVQANMHWKDDHRAGTCPVCKVDLQRIPVGAFAVDRCPNCSGTWFDGGELGPMLTDQGFTVLLMALLKAQKEQKAGQ